MKAKNTFGISFFIKKYKRKGEQAPLYARITVDGKSLDLSLKRKAPLHNWDEGKGTVKGNKEEIRTLAAYLEQVRNRLYDCRQELEKERRLLTAEAIKQRYLGEDESGKTLEELMQYHAEEMKEELAPGTQKNYHTTCKYVRLLLKEKYKTSDLYLEELNYKFIRDFEKFVKNRKPTDHHKACGQNGAMKHIERLRKMINLALKEEWISRDPFLKFKAKFEKKERGYLSLEELERIEQKHFSVQRLALVRDLFVFSCYTGASYVEVSELTPDQVVRGMDGALWLMGQRKKSGEFFKVPLLQQALAIIERYRDDPRAQAQGRVLPVLSNQKLNSYLKEIADLCGIDKNLSFHLARHTFATSVTLANGVPIESVSKMLGHGSIRTTQIYAKVVEHKLSEDMQRLREKLNRSGA
ncbi:site-specific integrase [Cesiribacter andamanensis]|uniref:Tyrosine recombinase XerD n=1 Tax=Cesiribacter andamanensis AMV16 TaxID=1279009 RepID=M7MZZ9_9BACT|nr:site-specific integrase [Cesiribacter andamanensis]EMR00622.1 Tyrosine recombinase XerD [Cesiribacter andamanensis AMV16]